MNVQALVREHQAIRRALDLDPSKPDRHLGAEGLAHGPVRLGMAFGLVQLVVEGVGHVLAAWITIWRHAPVGARLCLEATDGRNRRLDDVLLGRRNAELGLLAQQIRVQLVAVGIVGFLVGVDAPWRLRDGLADDRGELVDGQRNVGAVSDVVGGVRDRVHFGFLTCASL